MTGRNRHDPRQADDPHERRNPSNRPARSLIDDIRPALRHASPVELVLLAAAVIEASTPRPTDPPEVRRPALVALVDGLVTGSTPEGRALARAMLPMLDDEVLSRRTERALGPEPSAPAPMRPRWLSGVTSLTVTDVVGRDDLLLFGLAWPGAVDATLVVSLTDGRTDGRTAGLADGPAPSITDADAVALPMTLVRAQLDGPAQAVAVGPIPAAVARDRILAALARGDEGGFPSAGGSDSWPMARPFVEWVTRRLVTETLRRPPRS